TRTTARPVKLSLYGFYKRYKFVEAGSDRRPLYIQTSAGTSVGATIPLARGRNSLAAATCASLFYTLNFTRLRDLTIGQSTGVSNVERDNIRLAGLTPAL